MTTPSTPRSILSTTLKLLLRVLIIAILTIITQIGGLVYLFSIATFVPINKKINNSRTRLGLKTLCFVTLYAIFTFVIVPITVRPFGRVPLPIFEKGNVKPGNMLTCLLNRHYVRPQLREITYQVAAQMNEKYPGSTVVYLDANFPFMDGFPLFPHLSHNDGKKLDIAFQYNDSNSGRITNRIPSFIGYGVCEEPREKEQNTPKYCAEKGYWQYSLLRNLVPQSNRNKFVFDAERTKALVENFAAHPKLGKIFIEPHLKTRLGLTSLKVRFHGCQAVRHDDHIHVQLY